MVACVVVAEFALLLHQPNKVKILHMCNTFHIYFYVVSSLKIFWDSQSWYDVKVYCNRSLTNSLFESGKGTAFLH